MSTGTNLGHDRRGASYVGVEEAAYGCRDGHGTGSPYGCAYSGPPHGRASGPRSGGAEHRDEEKEHRCDPRYADRAGCLAVGGCRRRDRRESRFGFRPSGYESVTGRTSSARCVGRPSGLLAMAAFSSFRTQVSVPCACVRWQIGCSLQSGSEPAAGQDSRGGACFVLAVSKPPGVVLVDPSESAS